MPGRKRDDQIAMNLRRRARRDNQTAIRGPPAGRDPTLDLRCVAHVDRPYFRPGRGRRGLDHAELGRAGRYGGGGLEFPTPSRAGPGGAPPPPSLPPPPPP